MKDFIERTLGTGTYMKSRPKLDATQSSSQSDSSFSSLADNSTNFSPVSAEQSGQSHSSSQVGVGSTIANHRAAYVRKDEETLSPDNEPPTVTPDSRLQKSLNLSLPEIMKSENITTESISKMVELSSGSPVVANSPVESDSSVPLGNGSIAVPVPTAATITSNNSSVLIPITTTIAPSQLSGEETTTATIINFAKENNGSTIALLEDKENKPPLLVESHLNETKSETLPELVVEPSDMVIEGSGFSSTSEQPENNEPFSKNEMQTEDSLTTPASDELLQNSEMNPMISNSQNTQIEETTTVLSLPEEVTTILPPVLKMDESLKGDQFTTIDTFIENIETTTKSAFISKEDLTNLSGETSNLSTSPTVTTFMPEPKESFSETLLDTNSTQV